MSNPYHGPNNDRRVEDWRMHRIEQTLDGLLVSIRNVEQQMERIVRLEERASSRDNTIRELSLSVQDCDERGEGHSTALAALSNEVKALTWYSRLITTGIVGGFLAWVWSLRHAGGQS